MNRFRKTFAAAAAAAVLTLAGCGAPGEAAEGDAEGGEVVIGYQPGNTVALLMAQGTLDERLEAEGYDVVWEELAIGTLVLEALNTGNIDFGHSSDANAIFSAANGRPIEYAASENPYPNGVALVSQVDSGIEEVTDLEGTTVGVVEGGNMHYLLLRALEQAGLSAADLEIVYYANAADGMAAFQQGEFDVFGTWDPFLAIIQEQMETTTVLDAEGLTDNRTFYFATEAFMETKPEVLSIILEELQESNQWANENPDEAAAILADALGLDPAPLETANARREYGVLAMDDAAVQAQQDLADTFFDAGLIQNEITIADYVNPDPTWIPENVH
ncbi:aliphatic sulfonate ABC transporter substrate-binding protein [Agrococcus sp. ARC_14]|uniref:aliphatic sulfonate ABC transporter substrate-binding protein n=1 Tax=Agrococcus sp. ARC_14 TaxID=2919927 RepID=UPI001F0643CA|nr:aliphatic sulfonate ABC transporter substrate-binding protein [Agrococcus sp. ARC_14]MCH1883490.1 aliphatic sulfonate ABC transporter substrate-binding protein [Agrococcus sp. ARC_14]